MSAVELLCLAAGAGTAAWALGRLEVRRAARAAQRAALFADPFRPVDAAPLLEACCERWFVSRGREHERTCRIVVEEVDGRADPS